MALIHLFVLMLVSSTFNGEKKDDEELKDAMEKVAEDRGIDPDNLKSGQVYMIPPELTDEEEGSRQMPRSYRCSGCMAVVYQFEKGFSSAEKKLKKGSKLAYSDVLEITEDVCDRKLNGYGVKNINGKKFLSGEGLKYDKDMGIMEAGGRWEVWLKIICAELIELYEEEDIYDQYVKRGNRRLAYGLCSKYCSQEEMEKLKNGKDEL